MIFSFFIPIVVVTVIISERFNKSRKIMSNYRHAAHTELALFRFINLAVNGKNGNTIAIGNVFWNSSYRAFRFKLNA